MKKISLVVFLAVVLLPFTASTEERKDITPTCAFSLGRLFS